MTARAPEGSSAVEEGLDLERLAKVEITSEAPDSPIEGALLHGSSKGWRAAEPGPQTITIIFDEPQRLGRVALEFEETSAERTQEFVLRWSPDGGRVWRELVRQQFTFAPPGTCRERESYEAQLDGVTALELRIVPDIRGGGARASLARLRIA